VKSWQRRFESLFRPGGGRGNESRSLFILLAVVALAVFILSGFFQIKAAEQGVILRFGKLVDIRQQGWGWRWPWVETVIKVPVASVKSSGYKSRVLTSEINLVDLRFAVQYQLSDPKKVLFAVKDPEATLSEVSEMAIREVVGRSELDNVLVGKTRPDITRRTKELIQRTLDSYNTGITITKANSNFVLAVGFISPDKSLSPSFISNYIDVYVKDALKRVPGVGDAIIFGERKYAMRLWLDPSRLAARGLTALDVTNALTEQNVEVAAGQLGQQPSDPKQ